MNDNLVHVMQNATVEQLKEEIDKIALTNKNLKDFNDGKKIIDSIFELNLNNIDDTVKNVLLLYCIYKIKGGKQYE